MTNTYYIHSSTDAMWPGRYYTVLPRPEGPTYAFDFASSSDLIESVIYVNSQGRVEIREESEMIHFVRWLW